MVTILVEEKPWIQTFKALLKKLILCCILLVRRVWVYIYIYFFGKSNIFKYFSSCQTRSYDFWIMNAMCTFIYLYVVYFSFAPVISASIHVNYFDIQVLRMVTETETLTSTLHHKIFTYLDCFFYYLYTVGFSGNTPQGTNYTATCLPSRKLSKLDEPNTQGTTREASTSS